MSKRKQIMFICVFVVLLSFFLFSLIEDEKVNTSYRVYTKNGWSKWSKNGKISGDKKNAISKIEIKIKNGNTIIVTNYGDEWNELKKDNKSNIKGIKILNEYKFSKKYQTCYRTFNKKNKWLNWTCDSNVPSGNKNQNILAIEIITIPNNVVLGDYLKDYYKNDNPSFIGFEE